MATSVSISGSGKADVTVYGRGTVIAGNGNDKIDITGNGTILVGSGNDTLTVGHGGTITEHGVSGHDTIHIGSVGNYTIIEQGSATVSGAFGQATISGGELKIIQTPGQPTQEVVIGGHVTLIGAGGSSGAASGTTHQGGSSTGHDSASGSASHSSTKVSDFVMHQKGSPDFGIKNFVSGEHHLSIAGHSLSYMLAKNPISMHSDQTMIHMDGGKTMIALHGVNILGDKH